MLIIMFFTKDWLSYGFHVTTTPLKNKKNEKKWNVLHGIQEMKGLFFVGTLLGSQL